MSEYCHKLSTLSEKMQKLMEEEKKLITQRKIEIAHLAEKFGLLTLSNECVAGLFAEAQSEIQKKSEKLTAWEQQGEQLLKIKRINRKEVKETAS